MVQGVRKGHVPGERVFLGKLLGLEGSANNPVPGVPRPHQARKSALKGCAAVEGGRDAVHRVVKRRFDEGGTGQRIVEQRQVRLLVSRPVGIRRGYDAVDLWRSASALWVE